MKRNKKLLHNVLLVCGVISAITGAIDGIGKTINMMFSKKADPPPSVVMTMKAPTHNHTGAIVSAPVPTSRYITSPDLPFIIKSFIIRWWSLMCIVIGGSVVVYVLVAMRKKQTV